MFKKQINIQSQKQDFIKENPSLISIFEYFDLGTTSIIYDYVKCNKCFKTTCDFCNEYGHCSHNHHCKICNMYGCFEEYWCIDCYNHNI